MEEKQKKVIQKNWLKLIETINADALVPYFISALILTPDDEDTISAGKTLKEQNKTFLHMIYKKGPNTFHTLIQALKRENDDHIAALLEDGIKKESDDTKRTASQHPDSVALCPQCLRPLQCPECSQLYDEGFSRAPKPSQVLPRAKSYQYARGEIETSERLETATMRKTTYDDPNLRYEPLVFESTKEGKTEQPPSFGLDFPDSSASVLETDSAPSQNVLPEVYTADLSVESDSNIYASITDEYENFSPTFTSGRYEYENISSKCLDDRRILLTSPLKLPIGQTDPEVENNEYFKYFQKHLGKEEGWYPLAYTVQDVRLYSEIENVMGNCTEEGQYLIWYEGIENFSPYISVYCSGTIIRHFRIQTTLKTGDKKRVFYIDSKYQFQRLEELVEHVKQYGISLDQEFKTEAALF